MFHQSGGCCDGLPPRAPPAPRPPHLTVDVVTGRGSGFSVEAPEGVRFLIRSRLMSEDELHAFGRSRGREALEPGGRGALAHRPTGRPTTAGRWTP